jgi:hypothetical protein
MIASEQRVLRTPRSLDTSSDEVFEVAQSWIKKCTCAAFLNDKKKRWYPKRLLDLEELREADGLREIGGLTTLSVYGDPERAKIRLVEIHQGTQRESASGE